jgi:hypothetical protein
VEESPASAITTVQTRRSATRRRKQQTGVRFECGDLRSDLLHDANAFMAEDHVCCLMVLVCTTQASMGDFEQHFVWFDSLFVSF